jgi:hypothetical protein
VTYTQFCCDEFVARNILIRTTATRDNFLIAGVLYASVTPLLMLMPSTLFLFPSSHHSRYFRRGFKITRSSSMDKEWVGGSMQRKGRLQFPEFLIDFILLEIILQPISVGVNCCWPSPAQSFLVSDPVGTHYGIFIRYKIHLFWNWVSYEEQPH